MSNLQENPASRAVIGAIERNLAKPSQKRTSSPLSAQNIKKSKTDDSVVIPATDGKSKTCHEALQNALTKQIELVEQLVFKDLECQRLKKKYDEVDRNCRRWLDFAIGLQSRVKRLALILHRQQDSIRALQRKEVKTASVAIQTDRLNLPMTVENDCKTAIKTIDAMKENNNLRKHNTTYEKVTRNCSETPVVIDLTDEESAKYAASQKKEIKFENVANSLHKNNFQLKGKLANSKCIQEKRSSPNYASSNANIANLPGRQAMTHSSGSSLWVANKPVANCTPILNPSTRYLNIQTALDSNGQLKDPKCSNHSILNKTLSVNTIKLQQSKNGITVKNLSPNRLRNCAAPYPPLPSTPPIPANVPLQALPSPPQPLLKIKRSADGIELSWNHVSNGLHAKMHSYELYVYQHNTSNNSGNRWKKIGNDGITAMALPMACTLSQFSCGSIYYFAVRGKDIHGRYGMFSMPCCSNEVQS